MKSWTFSVTSVCECYFFRFIIYFILFFLQLSTFSIWKAPRCWSWAHSCPSLRRKYCSRRLADAYAQIQCCLLLSFFLVKCPVPPLDFLMRLLWCCCNQRQRPTQRVYGNPSFPNTRSFSKYSPERPVLIFGRHSTCLNSWAHCPF